jgi:hypothetical protein
MEREQLYVRRQLQHLESWLKSWVATKGNSTENCQELDQMMKEMLLKSAEDLTEVHNLGR